MQTTFYIRDLSILRFWYPHGGPGISPPQVPRDDCTCIHFRQNFYLSGKNKHNFVFIHPLGGARVLTCYVRNDWWVGFKLCDCRMIYNYVYTVGYRIWKILNSYLMVIPGKKDAVLSSHWNPGDCFPRPPPLQVWKIDDVYFNVKVWLAVEGRDQVMWAGKISSNPSQEDSSSSLKFVCLFEYMQVLTILV